MFAAALESKVNVACLFDRSGGKGLVPSSWPLIRNDVFCGYAGGLGPETLSEELLKIFEMTNGQEIWIDMESKIRTEKKFDLGKVVNCLETAQIYRV